MKSCVTWLLVLLTIHAPIPCPDLDGECRGAPINSLTEAHAWHVLLMGIQPADDIDRGPIRPSDSEHPVTPDETPLGKLSIVGSAAPSVADLLSLDGVIPCAMDHAPRLVVDADLRAATAVWRESPSATSSCRRLAQLCVWRV